MVLGPGPEEAGALRRTEPLVAVAGVDVRAEGLQLEWDVARGMRAVDDREHARNAGRRADLLDGEHP